MASSPKSLSPKRVMKLLKSEKNPHSALSIFDSVTRFPGYFHSPDVFHHILKRLFDPKFVAHVSRIVELIRTQKCKCPEDVALTVIKAYAKNKFVFQFFFFVFPCFFIFFIFPNYISNVLLTNCTSIIWSGKFFLVDCGFPNRRQFLAPFRGVRYHLQDFLGQGRDPKTSNELFNHRHASLRNTIERIFGIFKSRFTIFKIAPPFPYDTQAELVLACAGLHNFLRKECRSDEFPEEQDNEGSSSSPIPVNEEDNFEPVFETQEEQREHANQWRDAIAANMWNDVERFNNNEQ